MAWGMASHSFNQLAGVPGACSCLAGKPLLERRQVNRGWYLLVAGYQEIISFCLKQSLGDSGPLPVFSVTSPEVLHTVPLASLAAVVVVVSHCCAPGRDPQGKIAFGGRV